jgi:Protein of unknown function (DUF3301)
MELGWSSLALLCVAAAGAWFWQDSLAARESANAAAMEACERLGLQFLDGTAAFARLSLTRESGWLTFRRTYVFDYTANSIERRQGFVVLIGRRVESVGYARSEESRLQQARSAPPAIDASGILHLDEWRTRTPKLEGDAAARPSQP